MGDGRVVPWAAVPCLPRCALPCLVWCGWPLLVPCLACPDRCNKIDMVFLLSMPPFDCDVSLVVLGFQLSSDLKLQFHVFDPTFDLPFTYRHDDPSLMSL